MKLTTEYGMLRLGTRPWWVEWRGDRRDLWIGLYWTWKAACYGTAAGVVTRELHLYVCLLPCLPLHVVLGLTSSPPEHRSVPGGDS